MSLIITTLALLLAMFAMINLSSGNPRYGGNNPGYQRQFQPPRRQQQQSQPVDRQKKRWYQQAMPQCAALTTDTNCVQKCENNPQFNRGFLDYHKNCRCYDKSDVFYYVDLKGTKPQQSTDNLCWGRRINNQCDDKCQNQEGWQTGYCFQRDVCQCLNRSRQNLYYLKEICYE